MDNTILSEVITRTTKLAYNAGVDKERSRIVAILKTMPQQFNHNDFVMRAVAKAIAEIKE